MQNNEFSREAELGFRAFGLSSDARTLYELTRDCRMEAVSLRDDLDEARQYLDRLLTDIKELHA